jgi:fatty-acyl-CoA synthase
MSGPNRVTSSGTYLDALLRSLASGGDREAIIHGDQRMSYAQLHRGVLRMAGALLRCGLRRGDGVAIFTGNRAESVMLQVATHLIGARLVHAAPEPGLGELRAFVVQATPKAFVFDPGFDPRGEKIASELPGIRALSFGPAGVGTDLLALLEQVPPVLPGVKIGQDDIVTVLYTGGTTGHAKLVTHCHLYYDVCVLSARQRKLASPGPSRVLVCTLPTHSSGHVSIMTGLLAGMTLVLVDDFDAGQALALIERERITSVAVNPPMLYELLEHPACPRRGETTLDQISYGGGPAAPAMLRQAIERFGPILRQSYGLTEAPFITVLDPAGHDLSQPERLRSCGRVLPSMELEARDGQGRVVAAGEIGEIWVRGLMMMTGYWNDPERTRVALQDGWLRTGDLGYLDAGGYLYLVDRIKDIIVTGRGADNVYSRLLDDFLASLPGVRSAATVGVPHERWGEAVHVFAVAEPGASLDAAELTRLVVGELGEVYEPQGFTFLDALPLTPLGKIDKKALRGLYTPS